MYLSYEFTKDKDTEEDVLIIELSVSVEGQYYDDVTSIQITKRELLNFLNLDDMKKETKI